MHFPTEREHIEAFYIVVMGHWLGWKAPMGPLRWFDPATLHTIYKNITPPPKKKKGGGGGWDTLSKI